MNLHAHGGHHGHGLDGVETHSFVVAKAITRIVCKTPYFTAVGASSSGLFVPSLRRVSSSGLFIHIRIRAMDGINALRIQLTEEVAGLPVALQSSFPDLGVDFLYHVFHDVMHRDGVEGLNGMRRRDLWGDGVGSQGDGDTGNGDHAIRDVPRRSSKRLRSLSDTTVGGTDDDDDGDDDECATTVSGARDGPELKHLFERALEHLDRIAGESERLEDAALSMGARHVVGGGASRGHRRPLRLVRCLTCGKTLDEQAVGRHAAHCQGLEAQTKDTRCTEGTTQTTDHTTRYTNDTGDTEETRRRAMGLGYKSNIAPIRTTSSDGKMRSEGLPLSPVAISMAAQAARQTRSFQGRPNVNIEPLLRM